MNLDISCIYKITSPSGRIYVGQTCNLRKRLNHYRSLLCKKQPKLYNSFMKYGYDNHKIEVIIECNIDMLNYFEHKYQIHFKCIKEGLNLTLVGFKDKSGKMSEQTKKKISIANKGVRNGMYGKKISEKTKNIQRLKLSGSNNYLSKIILNTETGIYYDCLNDAAFSRNMIKGSLWAAIVKYKVNKTKMIYA
ncbi:MAG: hypothetical protein H7098_07835 [Oligoflexus sp.]|nr:hypothetical protein [Pseudopedobacter sp.]